MDEQYMSVRYLIPSSDLTLAALINEAVIEVCRGAGVGVYGAEVIVRESIAAVGWDDAPPPPDPEPVGKWRK